MAQGPVVSESGMISEIFLGMEGYNIRLVSGFYEPNGWWRWTGKQFAVRPDPPPDAQKVFLNMDFTMPEELFEPAATGPATVRGRVNGVDIATLTYNKPGRYRFSE